MDYIHLDEKLGYRGCQSYLAISNIENFDTMQNNTIQNNIGAYSYYKWILILKHVDRKKIIVIVRRQASI